MDQQNENKWMNEYVYIVDIDICSSTIHYYVSMAILFMQMHHNVILCVHCLSCLFLPFVCE